MRIDVSAYRRIGVWRSQSADVSAEAFPAPQDFRRSALRRRKAWFRIARAEPYESDPPRGHALKVRLDLTLIPDIPLIERVNIRVRDQDRAGSTSAVTENSHKKPSEKLQFHQFHGSFRVLTFLTRSLAVAIARKGGDSS